MKKMILSSTISIEKVESLYGKMTSEEKRILRSLDTSTDYVSSITLLYDVIQIFQLDISPAFRDFIEDQLDRNSIY